MELKIGKTFVGTGHPCFIVAEISANHNQSIEKAKKIVKAAKNSGANAIKIQTYTADSITLNSNKKDFKIPKNSPWSKYKNLWNLYNKAHTSRELHKIIFKEAKKLDMEYFSSPFDENSVDFLESLNVGAYKIASPEINHIPLIKKVAKTKKPVILSSGLSNLEDLKLAINTLKKYNNKKIIVLKCNTSYPSPIKDSNIITISDIKKRFKVLSGLSDHTIENTSSILSVALGGSLIEKHIKLDNDIHGIDSFFSLGPKKFSSLVKEIRTAELALGKISYKITKSASKNLKGMRSIYVSRKIKKGEKITQYNVKIIRPSYSLAPKHYEKIIGKISIKDLDIGDRISLKKLKDK